MPATERSIEGRPAAAALLQIATDVDPTIADAFERWCAGHVEENLRLPGFVAGRRLRRAGPASGGPATPSSLTLYALADESALETSEYANRTIGMPSHFDGRIGFRRSVYRELDPTPGPRTQPIGPAILHVTVEVEPAWRDRFVDWYAKVHVPAVLSAPGMLAARRYENAAIAAGRTLAPGEPTYCTIYEMEDAGVLARPSTVEAASKGPCPPELAPHRVAVNQVYEEIFRAAAGGPA